MTFNEAAQIVCTITPEQIEALCEIESISTPVIMTITVMLTIIADSTIDRIANYINKKKESKQ